MDSQYLANTRAERNIETGCFYMTRIHIMLLVHGRGVTQVTSLCPRDTLTTSAAREERNKEKLISKCITFSATDEMGEKGKQLELGFDSCKEERAGLITDLGLMSPK